MHSVLGAGPDSADIFSRINYRPDAGYTASSPSSSDSSYSSGGSDSSHSSASSKTSVSTASHDDFLLQNHQESVNCPASWPNPFSQNLLASQQSVGWSERELAPHERLNPRRSAARPNPPRLVREEQKKVRFVDNLVDSATLMVEVVWPLSAPAFSAANHGQSSNLPLRTFIEETLKRSKTSFSTLQVALYYLILIKAHVPKYDFTMEQPEDSAWARALQCGRRMFLAALILASKYLQDRNYSARAWSKITGLQVREINTNEMAFLDAVNWKLHIPEPVFDRWQAILLKFSAPALSPHWKQAVLTLNADLDNLPSLSPPSCKLAECSPFRQNNRRLPTTPLFTNQTFGSPRHISPTTVAPPLVLEPSLKTRPPPAPISKMLPTPNLRPMSSLCVTPAVGPAHTKLAMSLAQDVIAARFSTDCGPVRRGSYASTRDIAMMRDSQSLASSPDTPGSMISDHSSQFSRSSSISSASGSTCHYSLSRLATHNASALKLSDTPEDNSVTILASNPLTSDGLTASPAELLVDGYPTPAPDYGQYFEYSRYDRKRVRSPSDVGIDQLVLQQKVRSLLRTSAQVQVDVDGAIDQDEFGSANSGFREAQLPHRGKPAAKRPCFDVEPEAGSPYWRPTGGPGMWRGVL